ncbi:hypothetical protein CONCODRAFT_80278 [Conidiobolus coronatus NRRL 28638]|uniref:Uncharacterized protein n=1 Tax=Conidiobolus coronatus (strain ATCC 28846 / CBS 209.66 / NRRL 28638) TaxID=796925 RepID=A0A137NW93_CONC2|nr:hypothetical protein CONCODRAFT_80278 [Conidiobolus coronatus NRRL 28638]|eukprot:KXN67100.1 hypothetical protein CONCODRAFT_80278 [Conidiobolus coronatus NRRL 28638]
MSVQLFTPSQINLNEGCSSNRSSTTLNHSKHSPLPLPQRRYSIASTYASVRRRGSVAGHPSEMKGGAMMKGKITMFEYIKRHLKLIKFSLNQQASSNNGSNSTADSRSFWRCHNKFKNLILRKKMSKTSINSTLVDETSNPAETPTLQSIPTPTVEKLNLDIEQGHSRPRCFSMDVAHERQTIRFSTNGVSYSMDCGRSNVDWHQAKRCLKRGVRDFDRVISEGFPELDAEESGGREYTLRFTLTPEIVRE